MTATTTDAPTEAEQDPMLRSQIECVFGLGGGELEDEPWTGFTVGDFGTEATVAFWYEGPPDYVRESELIDTRETWELRTAIVYQMFSEVHPPEGWTKLASYASSGEAECWCVGYTREGDQHPSATCPCCEGSGLVYLGDGYAEVVFGRRIEDEDDD